MEIKPLKIIYLGTPQVAALALDVLVEQSSSRTFEVVAVVSQPPARAARGGKETPSPVHKYALENSIPVLCPASAKDADFIQQLERLQPDVCVTAAYGQVLPEAFLRIPKYGTLNIHPSLLPLYRGAAPVQRTIEAGDSETGVTLLFTVKAMDAGPIARQIRIPLDENIKAPELLEQLFLVGAQHLAEIIRLLPSGMVTPLEQDHSKATKAPKLSVEESFLDFKQPARVLHNKVRAFAGWPGTRARFLSGEQTEEVKIVTTRLCGESNTSATNRILLKGDSLHVVCGDGSILEILELQPTGKRVMAARDFWNGLKNKVLETATS